MTLRFHVTLMSGSTGLAKFVYDMYYEHETNVGGLAIGGRSKMKLIAGNNFEEIQSDCSQGLEKLILDLLELCHRHYSAMKPQLRQWQKENRQEQSRLFMSDQVAKGHKTIKIPSRNNEKIDPIQLNAEDLVLNSHKDMHDILYRAVQAASQGEFHWMVCSTLTVSF